MNLSDYILLPREQRIKHIDLTIPCVCYTGNQVSGRLKVRSTLLDHLSLVKHHGDYNIHCCHLCENGSYSGAVCLNPHHMYFGTAKENAQDIPADVRSETMRRANASRNPELRQEIARKASNTRTHEQLLNAARKTAETIGSERRSNITRDMQAARTPEQRSTTASKGWETRRRKKREQEGG
jgi:hypothetical protein